MGKGISRLLSRQNVAHSLISGHEFLANPNKYREILSESNLLLECLAEDFDLKTRFLRICSDYEFSGQIGTCTSSLSITTLQEYAPSPQKYAGVHFMNPPSLIRVVEIVPGDSTSVATIIQLRQWVDSLGCKIIEVKDVPGFLINSILFVMLNQAAHVFVTTGLPAETIDEAMKDVCGHKLGPLATLDMIGIDTSIDIIEELNRRDPDTYSQASKVLYNMRGSGELGRKSGKGFYVYK
jgi:methoxymalonate biosynthesis protein